MRLQLALLVLGVLTVPAVHAQAPDPLHVIAAPGAQVENDRTLKTRCLQYLVAAYGPDKLNDPSQAEPLLNEMIKIEPTETSNYVILSKMYEDAGQYDQAAYVFGACGGAAMYRMEMLEAVRMGGEFFDESYFAFGEDLDLSFRAQSLGYKCLAVPSARVYHRVRATASRLGNMAIRLARGGHRVIGWNRHKDPIREVMKEGVVGPVLPELDGVHVPAGVGHIRVRRQAWR